MKKLLKASFAITAMSLAILAAFTIMAAFSGPASAFGSWSWPIKEPSAYKVEAKGTDFRVYEWESDTVPGKYCVAVFANAGPVGLDCDQAPGKAESDRPVPSNSDW